MKPSCQVCNKVVVVDSNDGYEELQKLNDDLITKTRQEAKNNKTYKEVQKELDRMHTEANNEQDLEWEEVCRDGGNRERQRKKRKRLNPFREYTTPQGEEGKFKGWSTRAANDMAALCKKLKEQSASCQNFRRAYREIQALRNENKPKIEKKVAMVEVDYAELWDVGDINIEEI